MWIDSTASLTAPRSNYSIAVGMNVAAWCIRAPTELGNVVFVMYNVSIVSGRVRGRFPVLPVVTLSPFRPPGRRVQAPSLASR